MMPERLSESENEATNEATGIATSSILGRPEGPCNELRVHRRGFQDLVNSRDFPANTKEPDFDRLRLKSTESGRNEATNEATGRSAIRPLFPFYGSKWRDAKRYPQPVFDHVVEPFAGSAGYSLYWAPRRVSLFDADPIIVGVWSYLIHATPREILALPDLEVGESVDDLDLPQEARWLIGFWLNRRSAQPKKTRTAFSARTDRSQLVWGERARRRIADHMPRLAYWTITQASFEDIYRPRATWFIDPPYEVKGRHYRFSKVDYTALAFWVEELSGRVIVCEQAGAEWLPFEPLASIKSTRGRSEEVAFMRDRYFQPGLAGPRAKGDESECTPPSRIAV